MHPTSIFPQILFLGPMLTPVLLRLSVGLFMIYLGKDRYNKIYKWSSVIYILSGILLFLGLYTQPAAIIAILAIGFDFYAEKKVIPVSKEKIILYMIAAVILLSILFTGPGFLAFDLPL